MILGNLRWSTVMYLSQYLSTLDLHIPALIAVLNE